MTIPSLAANYILEHGFGTKINYILLGTGTTAPTINDTKLVTEILRLPCKNSIADNKLYYWSVLSPQYPTTNFKEVGLVRSGKLTKDTGNLFSRLLNNFTKNVGSQSIIKVIYEFTDFIDI